MSHKVICEVSLKDNIKIVTFRSCIVFQNHTLLPLEMVVVDKDNYVLTSVQIIGTFK